jgi:hypothetical protein
MSNIIQIRSGPPPDGLAEEFVDLVVRCFEENPNRKDLAELKKQLEEMPRLSTIVFDLSKVVREQITKELIPQRAAQIALNANVNDFRRGMDYDDSPTLEKLLIDNVVNTWLRLQWAELRYNDYAYGEHSMTEGNYWNKVLSAAQRRHLRACESLARIRRITRKTPALQINLAEQQINVAGDLVKSEGE